MKFIVDAQLPELLKNWLNEQSHDAIHTNDMPLKEQTPDMHIIELADEEDRIVISKDSDFFKYNLITGKPRRILMVTTGNIVNKELIRLFELNFEIIATYFETGSLIVELDNESITVHA